MDKNNLLKDEKNKALEQLEEWHINKAFQIEDKEFKMSALEYSSIIHRHEEFISSVSIIE